MASPNSLLTKIRIRLAQYLDPHPDKGEAWCVDCVLNGGRTLVVPAHGHSHHISLHRDQQGGQTSIAIRVNWGRTNPYDEDDD
jgi:hypothetical protein